jgi:hypothetical protein
LQTTLKPFNNSKLSVQVDPSFESSDISVEFNFQSKQELMEKLISTWPTSSGKKFSLCF